MKAKQPMPKPAKKGISAMQVGIGVGVLIFILIVYLLLQPGVITITNTRSLTLNVNQTQFIRVYNGSNIAVKLSSVSSKGAVLYISRTPELYSTLVSVSLPLLNSANVSSGGTGVSDMNILLLSLTGTSATLQVTPLLAALAIRPSGGITLTAPSSLANIGKSSGGVGSNSSQTTATTTTAASSSTTTVSQNATKALFQKALQLMNVSGIGSLMAKYKALYQKSTGCTPSLYNSTYNTYYSKQPPAPVSYYNVSPYTPTDLTVGESLSKPNVIVTYSVVTPSSSTSGPVILVRVNTTSTNYIRNVSYTGIYQGLNFSVLNKSYSFQSKILNACGAYIPPPP